MLNLKYAALAALLCFAPVTQAEDDPWDPTCMDRPDYIQDGMICRFERIEDACEPQCEPCEECNNDDGNNDNGDGGHVIIPPPVEIPCDGYEVLGTCFAEPPGSGE